MNPLIHFENMFGPRHDEPNAPGTNLQRLVGLIALTSYGTFLVSALNSSSDARWMIVGGGLFLGTAGIRLWQIGQKLELMSLAVKVPVHILRSRVFRELADSYSSLAQKPEGGAFLKHVSDQMIEELTLEIKKSADEGEYAVRIQESGDWMAHVLRGMIEKSVLDSGWMCTLTNAAFWSERSVGCSQDYALSNIAFCNERSGKLSRTMVVPWLTELRERVDHASTLVDQTRAQSGRNTATEVCIEEANREIAALSHMQDIERMLEQNLAYIRERIHDKSRFDLRMVAVNTETYKTFFVAQSPKRSRNFAYWGPDQVAMNPRGALQVVYRTIPSTEAWFGGPEEVVYTPSAGSLCDMFGRWSSNANRTASIYCQCIKDAEGDEEATFERLSHYAHQEAPPSHPPEHPIAIGEYLGRLRGLLLRLNSIKVALAQLEHQALPDTVPES